MEVCELGVLCFAEIYISLSTYISGTSNNQSECHHHISTMSLFVAGMFRSPDHMHMGLFLHSLNDGAGVECSLHRPIHAYPVTALIAGLVHILRLRQQPLLVQRSNDARRRYVAVVAFTSK